MYKIILICFATFRVISSQLNYAHIKDMMDGGDKDKLRSLAYELVVESKYRIHQIDGLRDQFWNQISFHIGMIMGQIREKYKSMLEIYRQTRNKFTGKSKIVVPAISTRKPIHYFLRMEYISALEVDIDRLVHVLENIPDHLLVEAPRMNLRTGARDSEEEFELLKSRLDEKTKWENQEKYLMRKLGLPANSSVDDSWFINKNY